MAKYIKRAGIVFFVLVLSLLLAVGTICATGVVENNSNSIVNTNSQNNTLTENNNTDNDSIVKVPSMDNVDFDIPVSNAEILLTCPCPDGEPCSCGTLAEIWKKAITYSITNKVNVRVTLGKDWVAYYDDNEQKNVFGNGEGFDDGRVTIPYNSQITLDLNGHNIDRRLTGPTTSGQVVCVLGILNLVDLSFSGDSTNYDNLDKMGKITGGNSSDNCGGVIVWGETDKEISSNNSVFNFYSGVIVDNMATEMGGGVMGRCATANIYGGIIANNSSGNNGTSTNNSHGGGIAMIGGILNVYNCLISNNFAYHVGGGIIVVDYLEKNGYLNLYNGKIEGNSADSGGGVALSGKTYGEIYNGEITDNNTHGNSAGLLVNNYSEVKMYGGLISRNNAEHYQSVTTTAGGAVLLALNAKMTIYGGEISYNTMSAKNDAYKVNCAGIFVYKEALLNLAGGKIINNTLKGTFTNAEINTEYCGGIYTFTDNSSSSKQVTISGGVQVHGNKVNTTNSDLRIRNDEKIYISGKLVSNGQVARIGLCGSSMPDSLGYSDYGNGDLNPTTLFFYNQNVSVYCKLNSSTGEISWRNDSSGKRVTWNYSGSLNGSLNEESKFDAIVAEYKYGNSYKITCSAGEFYCLNSAGNYEKVSECTISDAGEYAFYYNAESDCFNPVFYFTITPKQVDILWKEDSFEYNGSSQKPIAYIKEDANCKVTTIGEKVNSGSGYIASATELSNKNYKINSSTMNKAFSIAKAKLEKPYADLTDLKFDGSEREFLPVGFDSNTMNITNNTAIYVGNYTAIVSLLDKNNYLWADNSNQDITFKYFITSEYEFVYIDEEGYRKTYKQGGIVHGVNDSDLNGGRLVLGNIAPNTSVKRFVETLGYDTSKIVIKDSAEKEIYVNGVPVDQSTYDKRFELAVGTGWRVEYTTTGGTEIIYLSVLGDINGDGRISASDCAYLREIANDKALYDSLNAAEIKLASLIINKGKVTSADSEILINVLNKQLTIDLFF